MNNSLPLSKDLINLVRQIVQESRGKKPMTDKIVVKEQAESTTMKPGSFKHYDHTVRGMEKAFANNDKDAFTKHATQLKTHYAPHPDNSEENDTVMDLDLGNHKSHESELRHSYSNFVVPKGKESKKNYAG